MTKLQSKLDSIEKLETFRDALLYQAKNNHPISDNPMIDGMIIGFIYSNFTIIREILLFNYSIKMTDATIQQIEQTIFWFTNNEEKLLELI